MATLDLLSEINVTNDQNVYDILFPNTTSNDDTKHMDITDEYSIFIKELSQYISFKNSHMTQKDNNNKHDFIHQLFIIIYNFIKFDTKLLINFSVKNKEISSNTKINCLALKSLHIDNTHFYTHPTPTCIPQINNVLWFTTNNNLILGYDLSQHRFIGKYENFVKNMYNQQNGPYYGEINNIKSFCLRHGNESMFMLYLANNGYNTNNFVYTNHYKCCQYPENKFALIRDSHIGKCLCNYIISELYCILGWITSMSVGEHWIDIKQDKQYNNLILYEYHQTNGEFKAIEELFRYKNDDGRQSGYVCWYLKDILQVFDMNKHIVFNQDNDSWIMYLPINIYKQWKDKNKIIRFEQSFEDVFVKYEETVDIDRLSFLYRMTTEYVLLRGRKKNRFWFDGDDGKWDKTDVGNLVRIGGIDCGIFEIMEQFDCVLNDYRFNRFIVTEGCNVFELGQSWENDEYSDDEDD